MKELVRIKVENFKSLKNIEIPLKQFNVLIGTNGSGKTNVLELIEFVNSCISPQKTPPYPFVYWGGYRNIVWAGNDRAPIHVKINYTIDNHPINYTLGIISLDNNRLEILDETLQIENYLKITLSGGRVIYSVEPPFAKQMDSFTKLLPSMIQDMDCKNFTIIRNDSDISILKVPYWHEFIMEKDNVAVLRASVFNNDQMEIRHLFSPIVKKTHAVHSLYNLAVDYITHPDNILFLRQLNYEELRRSAPVNYSAELDQDGEGLVNLLFQWFTEKQKLPDIFTLALEELFPGWQISFHVTQDGNIIMGVTDGQTKLSPSSIPDGFYKLLAILAAIELEPKILLIDEIETSLHARIIEYVLDLLRNTDSTVIITTHSPIVVDYVDIDDLILLESTNHTSKCRKIKNPNELKQELASKGITVSDSWLYGKL